MIRRSGLSSASTTRRPTLSGSARLLLLFVIVAIAGAEASSPKFFTGGHAERFPQGRSREPVNRQPRSAAARRRDRGCLRDGFAVHLGDRSRQRRVVVRRHRQRRPRVQDRRARQGHVVLRRGGTRSARARSGARRRPLCRHLARREDLQAGSERQADDLLRAWRTLYLGARHGCQRVSVCGDRREGRHLSHLP